MSEHELQIGPILWFIGWLAVVIVLFVAASRLPVDTRFSGVLKWLYSAACVAAGLGVWILRRANLAESNRPVLVAAGGTSVECGKTRAAS